LHPTVSGSKPVASTRPPLAEPLLVYPPLQPELQALVDAIHAAHAEGLLTLAEARAVNREFVDLARASASLAGAESEVRTRRRGVAEC
jgi:hypothetical protein